MTRYRSFLAVLILIGLTAFLVWRLSPHAGPPLARKFQSPALPSDTKGLQTFVDTHRADLSPKVQDQVGAARLRLAYKAADRRDFLSARKVLLQTAKEYKGTGQMSGDFGGIPDQAQYQAVCCLVGEGKKAQARAEFVQFMKDQPLSPLVTAAYRRIWRIDGHEPQSSLGALLQKDLNLQQKRIRFDTSVCGPKCIEHLLTTGAISPNVSQELPPAVSGSPSPYVGEGTGVRVAPDRIARAARVPLSNSMDYKQIAKLCGTTDQGTTILQLKKGMMALGIRSFGYALNVDDLARAPMPAIILVGQHYLAVEKIQNRIYTYFDPMTGAVESHPLPKDLTTGVPTLLFSPLVDL